MLESKTHLFIYGSLKNPVSLQVLISFPGHLQYITSKTAYEAFIRFYLVL